MISMLKKIWTDEDGAAAIEYALLIVGIALVAIVVASTLGAKVSEKFTEMTTALDGNPVP